jgi:TolB protein
MTRHYGIDTEPSWLPDGSALVFTSDRAGQPQIYQVDMATGYEERLTFDGNYNARARVLLDGSGIVLIHRSEGYLDYHIALQNIERGTIRVLTTTVLDESPTVAPNGSTVLYATRDGGRGILAAVSVDGNVKYNIPSNARDVREPAWSPYISDHKFFLKQ